MRLRAHPAREPAREARLLVRPHLDRAALVGRVEHVRERRLARERRRRAGALEHQRRARASRSRRRARASPRGERGPAAREDARRVAPSAAAIRRGGIALGEPRVERVAQLGVLLADRDDARRQRRIARDRLLDGLAAVVRELAVGVGLQVVVVDRHRVHRFWSLRPFPSLDSLQRRGPLVGHAAQLLARARQPRHHGADRHRRASRRSPRTSAPRPPRAAASRAARPATGPPAAASRSARRA